MNKKFLRGFCTLLCSFPLVAGAQTSTKITGENRFYEEGKTLFIKENYAASIPALEAFVKNTRDASLAQEAEYMLAVANFKLKDSDRVQSLHSYLNRFPDTPHKNSINALLASAYFYDEDYTNAVALYREVDFEKLAIEEEEDNIYRYAISNLKLGNNAQAATWFELLQYRSKKYDVDCQYYVSYIRYKEGKYDEALQGFSKLENNDKYASLVPYYIASCHYFKGDHQQAIRVAESYLKRYTYGAQTLEMNRILGESYFAMNQYGDAIKNFEVCVNNGKTLGRSAMYKLGMSYYKLGVNSKAISAFGDAANGDDVLSQNALLHLGLSYLNQADRTNARLAFQQAATMNHDVEVREKALYNYALIIHETSYSAFGESINVFERFLAEYPNSRYSDKVSDYLAELYLNTRSYDAALKSINRISQPSRRILEAKQKILFQMGTELFANQDYRGAINYFSESLMFGQYNRQTKADAHYWRGESYYKLNNTQEAARNYRDYLSLTPERGGETFALAYYNLGYIAFNDKRYEEAESLFSTYIQHERGDNRLALADAFNRRGDSYLQKRAFIEARGNYSRAINTDKSIGDYSLYQMALVSGIQKKYNDKVSLINRLVSEYPNSPYVAQAQYEEGRSYVQLRQNNNAIKAFNRLITTAPSNEYSRKAAAEIGLLNYQDGNYNEAIRAYKNVLTTYPGSDEAKMALKDLKSIYVDLNRVDEYVSFTSNIPGGIRIQPTEQDSLTYIAAEKRYMSRQKEEAEMSFERYLASYPNGAFSLNAHYYLSILNKQKSNNEKVLAHTDELLRFPDSPYYEEALVMQTEIVYPKQDYVKSLDLFKKLAEKTTSNERLEYAQLGRLHSAVYLKEVDEVIAAATDLLKISKLTPEVKNEALYYRGKSYYAKQKYDVALTDLQTVSKDTRTVFGAESKYLVANIYFIGKKYSASEKEILQFIEQSTPHAYWLARGFVLLSDVYMAQGRDLEARQYLLSLQQNYDGNDDIVPMINSRLDKLKTEVQE